MKKSFVTLAAFLLSTTAFANTYEYKCYSFFWNGYEGQKGTMSLTVNEDSAEADINEVSWDENLGGKLNPNYKSRGSLKFLKYGSLLLEEALTQGGKTLRDGSLGGIARVEGQAEGGFYQYKFICKR